MIYRREYIKETQVSEIEAVSWQPESVRSEWPQWLRDATDRAPWSTGGSVLVPFYGKWLLMHGRYPFGGMVIQTDRYASNFWVSGADRPIVVNVGDFLVKLSDSGELGSAQGDKFLKFLEKSEYKLINGEE